MIQIPGLTIAPAVEEDDGRVRYGERIVNGVLRYESPSGIDLADVRNDGGCLRKWYYRYVMHLREPEQEAQKIGTQGHREIQHYLTTGEDVLGTLARRGKHMIPPPGPDLLVEWAIAPRPSTDRPVCAVEGCGADMVETLHGTAVSRTCLNGHGGAPTRMPDVDPARAWVSVAGVPIIGYIDLAHERGLNYGGSEIDAVHEPEGTIEVRDWKFTGDPEKWAKSADQVGLATPMLLYGEAFARACEDRCTDDPTIPPPTHVRLTHGYFSTKKAVPGFPRSKLLTRDQVARRVEERVTPVVLAIIEAARAARPEDVPGNTRACHAFKGCTHLSYCSAGQRGSLEKMFGPAAVPDLIGAPLVATPPKEGLMTSVMDLLKINQPAAASAAPPPPSYPPDFPQKWADIVDAGHGVPTVSGVVANALSAFKGWNVPPGTVHNGEGNLKQIAIADFEYLAKVAGELKPLADQMRAQRASIPAILPPDAPASNPALAALPVQPTATEAAQGTFPAEVAAASAAIAAAQAAQPVQVTVNVSSPPVGAPVASAPVVEEPKKRGRGRPKGTKNAAKPDTAPAGTPAVEGETIDLYVDAIPDEPYENLNPFVTLWCDTLAKNCGGADCVDIRSAAQDTPLGFGKWKGALAAFVKASFDTGALPAGAYVLDARGSEIGEVVAEALRSKVDRYVRGVR